MAEEPGGGAAAAPSPEEEQPGWLPEGWTVITKTRSNGRVDRYYRSLLTGETLRSKAKVILHANRHMPPDVELREQSAVCLDEKQYSESSTLQDIEEAHFSVPDGWIVETKYRKGGKHPGASYKTYFNPVTSFKCYSLKDVFRYVTGREPRHGTKKRAALSSPDSVLTQIDGSSKRRPFGLENASRLKKDKIRSTATTQHSSTVRRSLFGSPTLSFNGIAELSLEDTFFKNYNMDSSKFVDAMDPFPLRSMDVCNMGGGNIWAGNVNDIFEGQPYHQNVFPEHCQEEAGKICNSIDEFIRNLQHDFEIPDINMAYTTYVEQEMFDQASNIGTGINTRPTVGKPAEQSAVSSPERVEEIKVSGRLSELSHSMQSDALGIKPDYLLLKESWQIAKGGLPFEETKDKLQDTRCERKKVETSSTDGLPRKPHEQMGQDSVSMTKKDELSDKSCGGAVVTLCETSADMMLEEKDELSKGDLPVTADDYSDTISSRQGCKAVQGKQSEPANNLTPPSPRENRESKTSEQMVSKLKRANENHPVASSGAPSTRERKERSKMAAITLPSRTSRRLAGLDAGPNAYVDIDEHALRRKKRLAKEKETTVEPGKETSSKAAEEECIVSQCPDNKSTLKAPLSTPPSDAEDKQLPEQDPIIVEEHPMATEQPVPHSTGEDPMATELPVPHSTAEDPITKEQLGLLSTREDPITTEHPVPYSTEPAGENPKPASAKTSLFGEAFLDPCLQFAVKTLTGDLPLFDAPAGGLFHQQTCPVNNSSNLGRRDSYHPSAYHAAPNSYFHHSNLNGFPQPHTPFPSDRVLNLNFATGTITRLSPFKYEFHSDAQVQGKGGSRRTR